jgi:hypothetical protein
MSLLVPEVLATAVPGSEMENSRPHSRHCLTGSSVL